MFDGKLGDKRRLETSGSKLDDEIKGSCRNKNGSVGQITGILARGYSRWCALVNIVMKPPFPNNSWNF
jgi:hypothetical protein